MESIIKFLDHEISFIEEKVGIIGEDLKKVFIPDGIALGKGLLEFLHSPVVEIALDQFVNPVLVTNCEKYIGEAIAALTTAENILSLPTPAERLAAFANWLKTQTADTKNALVVKLVQIIVKLADGNKLPGHVYDGLVQGAITAQLMTAPAAEAETPSEPEA